jgi:hypothetical protein
MSKKQAKDSVKDFKQQAQTNATNLSPIQELDMFDYALNRINVFTFDKAMKKLSDYIGIKFGRNNQILRQDMTMSSRHLTIRRVNMFSRKLMIYLVLQSDLMRSVSTLISSGKKNILITNQKCMLSSGLYVQLRSAIR